MATDPEINAIADEILLAFDSDVNKFRLFLRRASLETELAELESQQRIAQNVKSTADATYVADNAAIQAEIAAKKAEIDGL